MQQRTVSLEQIPTVPESSWDLPSNALYIQLGCKGCASQVCFSARTRVPEAPDRSIPPEDLDDLRVIMEDVGKMTIVYSGGRSACDNPCDELCPQTELVQTVVDLLNDRFESQLTTHRTE